MNKRDYVVVVSYGNASDLRDMLPVLDSLSEHLQCTIVGYDYPGYGSSHPLQSENPLDLKPSEQGCYEAIDAVHAYVSNELGFADEKQIWLGTSLGTGPTVDLVSRLCKRQRHVGGMILVNSFWSISRIVSTLTPLFYDMFVNGRKIGAVNVSTLLLHAENDRLIPPEHSLWLADVCKMARLLIIPNCDHNNTWDNPIFWMELKKFVDTEIKRQIH